MEISRTLHQVVEDILTNMKSTGFSNYSIATYRCALNRLLSIADKGGDNTYSTNTRYKFLNEAIYLPNGRLIDSRRKLHNRCDRIVTSFITKGKMEWGIHPKRKDYSLSSNAMAQALSTFEEVICDKKLKKGTINVYKCFIHKFLCFMESKDVFNPLQIKNGNVTDFIVSIRENGMDIGSLRAGLSGLRLFLSINNLDSLIIEVPVHLPRKRKILEVYTRSMKL